MCFCKKDEADLLGDRIGIFKNNNNRYRVVHYFRYNFALLVRIFFFCGGEINSKIICFN